MEERRAQRIATFRVAVVDRLSRLGVSWIQLESGVAADDGVAEMLRELHALKGEAAVLGFRSATDLVHVLEAAVQRGPGTHDDAVLQAFDVLVEMFQADPAAAAPAGLAALVEQLGGSAGPAEQPTAREPTIEPVADETSASTSAAAEPAHRGARRDVGMRIGARQLDRMRDAIGDLFTLRIRLTQLADQLRDAQNGGSVEVNLKRSEAQLRDDALVLATLLGSLEENVRELRMVPLGVVLERFPRIARDLGRELGKSVRVTLQGESSEVDRDVIEVVESSLLHLVRNAIDHGIEPADQRTAHGKPGHGTLRISASVAGRLLQVTVADDGDGIDVAAVRRAAAKRGLADATTEVTDERALQWIMLPGFTTRDQATQISGRGVGLDAVHAGVQALGGSLSVASVRGRGTTFQLSIPISTAITTVLLFKVGSGRFALPIGSVEDVVSAHEFEFDDALAGPVIVYRGANVPVLDLARTLDKVGTFTDRPRLMLVRTGLGLVACSGSQGHEHRDVVLRPAGSLLSAQQAVTAAIALEGGEVALVLNPARLHADLGRSKRAPAHERARTVLVVDDSPIIRDIESEVLRSHGLIVIEASDGLEALENLDTHPEIELVITDVEMPRMNGLELVTHLRARPGRRIPAVVVSTRGTDADKLAATSIGADAYLVKTDLSHDSLWSLIGRYLGEA